MSSGGQFLKTGLERVTVKKVMPYSGDNVAVM